MKWGKFFAKSVAFGLVLWLIFIFAYGYFYLVDNVVPMQGTEIDEWINYFYIAGAVNAVVAIIFSAIWFYMGLSYTGASGIGVKHNLLWLLTLIIGFVAAYFIILPAQDGAGVSLIFAGLLAPVAYYLNSLFNSAEAVKYIPLLGDIIHK